MENVLFMIFISWMKNSEKISAKLTYKATHPENNKQDVSLASAVFDETTTVTNKIYYPNILNSAKYLNLFHIFMLFAILNSFIFQISCNGNDPIADDCKSTFLDFVANWVENWSLCLAFTLTKQMPHALVTTLRATSRLNTDLHTESSYQFVLTSTFQSDAVKRHFSKFSQTCCGHHLLSLLEVDICEK